MLVAEHQHDGHGRCGRAWRSPAQAGVHVSVLLRPDAAIARDRWGWLPLLTGVALVEALAPLAGVPLALKWPNDLLIGTPGSSGFGKVAGILAEVDGAAVVVGIGLNVTTRTDELPVPAATSLALAGAHCTDRLPLLCGVLRALERRYRRWSTIDDEAGPDAPRGTLREVYRSVCATVHRSVRVSLPDGSECVGRAVDVDAHGRLVVRSPEGVRHALAAGDVVHVR